MRVEAIAIGPSEALAPGDSVQAEAGHGLAGDRKYVVEASGPAAR